MRYRSGSDGATQPRSDKSNSLLILPASCLSSARVAVFFMVWGYFGVLVAMQRAQHFSIPHR
jgi:hypothetical protein